MFFVAMVIISRLSVCLFVSLFSCLCLSDIFLFIHNDVNENSRFVFLI